MKYFLWPLLALCLHISAAHAQENHCVSEKLVNSCHAWFGANVGHYKEAGKTMRERIEHFEQRVGRKVDIAHTYHGIGDNQLSGDDYYFISRYGTILFTNWKPAARWSDAAGDNPAVNATIDQMARSIKKAAPKKIFLTLYHEPEDQVEGGTSCPSYNRKKEKAGEPADYRAMWKNIRIRFNALNVDNVVWVMNYMGYERWNCMVNDLWPGNELVDWIVWDPYTHASKPWPESPMNLYQFLSENSTPEHDYLSKPWGLGEFGVWGKDEAFVASQYEAIYKGLTEGLMPRLKMYVVFDNRDSRVGKDHSGNPSSQRQAAFNRIANHPRFLPEKADSSSSTQSKQGSWQ